ncbi:unnamed protein product, partial [Vitis vinifera]
MALRFFLSLGHWKFSEEDEIASRRLHTLVFIMGVPCLNKTTKDSNFDSSFSMFRHPNSLKASNFKAQESASSTSFKLSLYCSASTCPNTSSNSNGKKPNWII